MINEHDDERDGSLWGSVGAMTVAAAVGAGVALLFSTDTGRRTRRQVSNRIHEMELRDRAEMLGSVAKGRIDRMRGRRPQHRNRTALYAALGTAAGATIAAAMAPESTRRARVWVEDTLDELRHNASTRWKTHRARRDNRMTPDTAKAMRRLEESVEFAPGEPGYVEPIMAPEESRGDMPGL